MHAESIAVLQAIEKEFDTTTLTYRGVSYWPLCRLRLWSALFKRITRETKHPDAAKISNAGPSWPNVGQINAAFTGPPELGLLRADQKPGKLSMKPRALFFLRPEEYSDKVADQAFAKVGDSLYERAAAQHAATKIELSDPRVMGFKRFHPSLFLHLETAGQGVAYDPPGTLDNFAALAKAVAAHGDDLVLDPTALTEEIGKIFYFARIFEKVLRGLDPRVLFLSVYYHPVGMAWMLACRWAGVKSIDLQHGRLGPNHGLYTQLTAAPPGGYHLLPDAILCWGNQTKHDIEVDKNPACARHGGIVGGNPWLYKWRYGDTAGLEPPEAAAFAARFTARRKILVSLQPLENPLTPELLKAMRQSPQEWMWLLRLHPLRRHTKPEVAAVLKDNGITNCEIDETTVLPLFSLLRQVEHHVTVFSSVAVEAATFGLRTSLLGAEGPPALAALMKHGTCSYTPTAELLLADIARVLNEPPAPVEDDFIDMREGVVDAALRILLD